MLVLEESWGILTHSGFPICIWWGVTVLRYLSYSCSKWEVSIKMGVQKNFTPPIFVWSPISDQVEWFSGSGGPPENYSGPSAHMGWLPWSLERRRSSPPFGRPTPPPPPRPPFFHLQGLVVFPSQMSPPRSWLSLSSCSVSGPTPSFWHTGRRVQCITYCCCYCSWTMLELHFPT